MIQTRERHRFGAEPLQDVAVAEVGVQDLDRDFAIERLVHRLVDGAHAAAAEALDDPVFADCFANHGRGDPQNEAGANQV